LFFKRHGFTLYAPYTSYTAPTGDGATAAMAYLGHLTVQLDAPVNVCSVAR